MTKRLSVLVALALVALALAFPAAAEEEEAMIVMTHLGGSLAVNLEAVETVFYMEKDGRQRFHLVWQGNAEGKTIEGAEAAELWGRFQGQWKDEFLWAPHMGGSLGISRDKVTSVFFMPEKDGKPATLRINYGGEAKTIEGAEAEALWKALSK